MPLEIQKKSLRGCFILLPTKGNIIKIAQFLLETVSGPLLSECQAVARVASLRDPVEMLLFDFSSRCLSPAPYAQPVFLSLSLAPSLCAVLICR